MNDLQGKIARFRERLGNMHRQSGRNWISIGLNIMRLKRSRGFIFVEIHDNELDLRGREYEESFLNWEEQKRYLELLNPRKYYSLARNKYLAHLTLDAVGIKDKSRLLCYYNPEMGLGTDKVSVDCASTLKILSESGERQFVVKTTESSHGDNVWVIKDIKFDATADATLERFDGETLRLSELLKAEPLIFETLIHQSEQMRRLNASSVNTIRFMTTLMPSGEARVIACFVKVGRAGRCVDNAGSGGNVDAGVDVETGRIFNPILFKGWRNTIPITEHPDSHVALDNLVVENWDSIKAKVISFQQRLPFVKAAGWDIAITENGPMVIEVNDMWDRTGQLFIGRGWKAEIRECYEAWRKYYTENK